MQSRKIVESTVNVSKNSAISLKDLSIIFNEKTKEEFKLLDNINYEFKKNKIHFIVGPSGCGKTVLASHLNGLMITKHGTININGEPIVIKRNKIKNVMKLRKTIGMCFQFAEYQLFKKTIEKDIMFGPLNFGVKKHVAKVKAGECLSLVGIPASFLQRNPFGLSGGQKRRVAIAGILAYDPDILVFDEPTAGLDPQGEKEIKRIICDLKKLGKTIIVITHTMNHALDIGDNIVVLGNKKVLKDGNIYDIFADKELIANTQLSTPSVIDVIEKLVKKDSKFSILLE
jgi:energy-coupling factor transport system ATP-binding protein